MTICSDPPGAGLGTYYKYININISPCLWLKYYYLYIYNIQNKIKNEKNTSMIKKDL